MRGGSPKLARLMNGLRERERWGRREGRGRVWVIASVVLGRFEFEKGKLEISYIILGPEPE